MKIVVVTACPCGMAHSRMASAALRKEAQALGYEIYIEEQGGWQNPQKLKPEQIAQADIVMIAAAIIINGKERFKDKKVINVNLNDALKKPKETLLNAVKYIENVEKGTVS
jgi:fructose-specific phosphotransferase system IIB component